ncbi:unnamed protein product [Pelagomonas calceolata]|uniref:SAP domain-containing protein n=1 Tax=Pelagomonas calceolata TaxID=35677 RepID=A0A8J2SMK2_9STRA|nr:unnamed protein product [Pelagomonas calceolata]|mmetsp:Transcript_5955/g.16843  ORF Transcript_5955/g.16843 Transcript_5955/m.16843 type:complete len:424 (+) Transcript_5955:178-1449(+)
MAASQLAHLIAQADAAGAESELHHTEAVKHGYKALTFSAHIMQERKILEPMVQDALRESGRLCGSPFEKRAISWFGGAPEDEQARELKLEEWAAAVGTTKAYCTWLVKNGGKANWCANYRSGQLHDFCLLAEQFKEANPQFVDGRWFLFDAPDFTDAVVDFFLKCHGPLLITNITKYCRELRAKERLKQEGQRSPAEIKRLAAVEAEGLDKLEKAVVRLGGEVPDLRGWKVRKHGSKWYLNGPGGEYYKGSISKAAAAIVDGSASTYSDDPFKAVTVAQLKAKCKEQGLKQTGLKEDLISRLKDAEKGIFDRSNQRKRPGSRAGGGEPPAKRVRTGGNTTRAVLEDLCDLGGVAFVPGTSAPTLENRLNLWITDQVAAAAPMTTMAQCARGSAIAGVTLSVAIEGVLKVMPGIISSKFCSWSY